MEGLSGEEKDSKRAREEERREEREALIKECQGRGGYYSAKFWEKAKWKTNKAPKALKYKKGELHKEEAAMAEIAREHFKLIGKGMTKQEGERKDANERYATVGTGRESKAKESFEEPQSQISYREVEEALKSMKRERV